MSKGEASSASPLPWTDPNHACYVRRASTGHLERAERSDEGPLEELFASAAGTELYRGPALAEPPIRPRETDLSNVLVHTSAEQVVDTCQRFSCQLPASTARLLASQVAVDSEGGQPPQGVKRMKGQNGKSMLETWSDLFAENEARVKAGKQPWTDDEIVAKMAEHFPQSAGKTSLTRIRMFRSQYNAGNFSFTKLGSAEKRGLPHSYKYDAEGNVVEPGKRLSAAAKDAADADADPDRVPLAKAMKKGKAVKKAGAKKAGGGKKVAKKAGKKAVKRAGK